MFSAMELLLQSLCVMKHDQHTLIYNHVDSGYSKRQWYRLPIAKQDMIPLPVWHLLNNDWFFNWRVNGSPHHTSNDK